MKKPSSYPNATADAGAGNPYPYGVMNDESAPAAGDGTPVQAAIVTDVQYAILAVLAEWSVTPNGSTEEGDSVTQLVDALQNMLKATDNPFMNYALFKETKASGVVGATLTAATLTKRDLTQVVNDISGASVASGVVTLPAGTYMVRGWSIADTNADNACYVMTCVSETDSSLVANVLVSGESSQIYCDSRGRNIRSEVSGQFTFGGGSSITLRTISTYTGGGQATSFDAALDETYAVLEIWKIA